MTAIDWIIIGVVLLFALYGALQGFVVGVVALVGFALGGLIGSRVGPLFLIDGSTSPYAPLFGLFGALMFGAVFATALSGFAARLRARVQSSSFEAVDGVLGALLTACLGLALAWLVGAVALHTPQTREYRRDIQRSFVLRHLNSILPPTGPILNALARYDPFPAIQGPDADVPAPRTAVARDPDVQAAGRGVVRILGTACGLGIAGSGWIAGEDLVVTNAHVVAGEDDTEVHIEGRGAGLEAQAVHFDATNDVAVLRVPGLPGGRALALAPSSSVRSGASGAVLGFPQNGAYTVRAARLGSTHVVRTQDAYGNGPVERSITALRGVVRPGNSGGPMVDSRGRVMTTIFAATVGESVRGGYGVPNEIVRDALADSSRVVGTGSCAG